MQGASFGCLKKPCCLDLSPLIVTISVILSLYETAKHVKKNGGVLSEINRIKLTREIKSMLESAFVAGFYICSVIKRLRLFPRLFAGTVFLCLEWNPLPERYHKNTSFLLLLHQEFSKPQEVKTF